ncbi:MAG: RNA polymerase sigma factor [Sphingobium sp.]
MSDLHRQRAVWLATHILPHEGAVRTMVGRWRLPAGIEVDDVIQESYANIARLPSVDQIVHPRNYFFATARTIFLGHVRREKLVFIDSLESFDMIADTNLATPEAEAVGRDELRRLAGWVAQLGQPARTAFMLRHIDNLGHAEIGRRLGLSENAVQKMLAKSLQKLALFIGRNGKPEVPPSSAVGMANADNDI